LNADLRETQFVNTSLNECDFSGTDLATPDGTAVWYGCREALNGLNPDKR